MNMGFRARIVALVAIGAVASVGVGATAAGAASGARPLVADFAGTYTLHYQFGGDPFAKGALTLTADHQGSDTWGDTISWSQSGKGAKTITITFTNPGSGTIGTYTGVQTASGIDKKKKPGTASLNDGIQGTWYATLAP
jgi:hypothetical protein